MNLVEGYSEQVCKRNECVGCVSGMKMVDDDDVRGV